MDRDRPVVAAVTKMISDLEIATTTPRAIELLDLNEDVLIRILEFLLSGVEVKELAKLTKTYKDSLKPTYHFYPAILRTCKTLHALGNRVLGSNHLILVSSKSARFFEVMEDHESIKLWRNNIKGARDKIELHMLVEAWHDETGQTKMETRLTTLDNLEALLFALKRAKLFDPRVPLSFIFQLKSSSATGIPFSNKVQQAFFALVAILHGSGNRCVIRGDVDEQLARRTEDAINPRIRWSRARDWDQYQLVCFDADTAAASYTAGNYEVAGSLYFRAWSSAIRLFAQVGMQKFHNDQLTDLYLDAVTTLLLNMMNTRLILSLGRKTVKSKTQFLRKVEHTMVDYSITFSLVDKTPKELNLKILLCSGIAFLGMTQVDRALSDFVYAKRYCCDGSESTCHHGDPKNEDPLLAE